MDAFLSGLTGNLEIALILFFFIWLFGWAKGSLGSAKLAVLFAIIVVYLTVYQYRELVWIAVILFLFATFGKELFSKIEGLK
jgi:hypothetical protein